MSTPLTSEKVGEQKQYRTEAKDKFFARLFVEMERFTLLGLLEMEEGAMPISFAEVLVYGALISPLYFHRTLVETSERDGNVADIRFLARALIFFLNTENWREDKLLGMKCGRLALLLLKHFPALWDFVAASHERMLKQKRGACLAPECFAEQVDDDSGVCKECRGGTPDLLAVETVQAFRSLRVHREEALVMLRADILGGPKH